MKSKSSAEIDTSEIDTRGNATENKDYRSFPSPMVALYLRTYRRGIDVEGTSRSPLDRPDLR